MWFNRQSVPRSPEHRDVSSSKRQMNVLVKSVSYFLPLSDLNANAECPSSDLPHSWSSSVRMDTSVPPHQHPEVVQVCSNLTLKLRHVPVKPAVKQKFTDGHGLPKRPGVRSLKHMMEVSLEDISYFSCEPDLNATVDHFSSPPPHSESREVRMDKGTPRSKLPVLKSKCVPVKPVNQQSFTDEPSDRQGVNHLKKGSHSVRMHKRMPLRHHPVAPRSKLPVLKSKCVPVKPVDHQSFTDEPSEWLGVGSNPMMKASQPVRMDNRTPLRKHSVAGLSKLPVLKSKCVPGKPVNQQCFTDEPSEWLGVGSCEHQVKVSLEDPPCESDLNVSVECSSSILAARVGKSQHPVLRPRCAPVKLLAGQKCTDEAPERQASRFPPLVNKAERNGTDPSCGSDWKIKPHLSLPSLPPLTSGLPALKPAHAPVRPALPSNFMFFPFDDEDVKMKRARSVKRSPSLLSRLHSATYF
ncbi:uncharacterized protein [Danio rerio]|uniref:Uncharacterized protein n=1 Tax=Danio rerio TaxID=7955 RepID=A0A8M1QVH8_DANRE|nr:uncharacterized protein LOC100151028 [Danio rerio]|eukprot:XP_001923909.3 uncharacterized protein LOC100151028 [Danio rerio]